MAKSARASVLKRNHQKLRAKVFGPVSDARTERLSAKLQELAAKPRPNEDKTMDVDDDNAATKRDATATEAQDMDVEMNGAATKSKATSKSRSSRIEKKTPRRKPKHQVVFPSSASKRKRVAASKKKSV